MKTKKETKFSVSLGLFDYLNPLFYTITSFMILFGLYNSFSNVSFIIFLVGAIISLIFGFTIPSVKLLVGIGKFEFKMPVNLVFYVNSGLLISGLTLFNHVFDIKIYLLLILFLLIIGFLYFIYKKTNNFNTVAVLTGSIGYIFIYLSLINISLNRHIILPIILFGSAILFFISLCIFGIKANLKDAKVHWIIESCNVICQCLVSIGTIILFLGR